MYLICYIYAIVILCQLFSFYFVYFLLSTLDYWIIYLMSWLLVLLTIQNVLCFLSSCVYVECNPVFGGLGPMFFFMARDILLILKLNSVLNIVYYGMFLLATFYCIFIFLVLLFINFHQIYKTIEITEQK